MLARDFAVRCLVFPAERSFFPDFAGFFLVDAALLERFTLGAVDFVFEVARTALRFLAGFFLDCFFAAVVPVAFFFDVDFFFVAFFFLAAFFVADCLLVDFFFAAFFFVVTLFFAAELGVTFEAAADCFPVVPTDSSCDSYRLSTSENSSAFRNVRTDPFAARFPFASCFPRDSRF